MTATVRVLVWYRTAENAEITRDYQEVSATLAETEGLLGSELLRSADDPHSYAILSEWRTLDAYRSWARGEAHRQAPEPLRRFRDSARPGGGYGVYQVAATQH